MLLARCWKIMGQFNRAGTNLNWCRSISISLQSCLNIFGSFIMYVCHLSEHVVLDKLPSSSPCRKVGNICSGAFIRSIVAVNHPSLL